MTKVNQVSLCPNCEEPLSSDSPARCLACGSLLKGEENPLFESPAYVSLERQDMIQDVEDTANKKDRQTKEKEQKRIDLCYRRWGLFCSDEDRLGALMDAKLAIETLVLSNATIDTTRRLTSIAKSIGELARTIEVYASKGGEFNVSEIRLLLAEPRDLTGYSETTSGRGDGTPRDF